MMITGQKGRPLQRSWEITLWERLLPKKILRMSRKLGRLDQIVSMVPT